MYLYYISEKDDLFKVLISRTIYRDITKDNFLYKKIPILKNDNIIIKLRIFNNDKYKITKLGTNIYKLNDHLSLEHREYKFLYSNEEQYNRIKKYSLLYKEVKDIDNNLEQYSYKDTHINEITKTFFNINMIYIKYEEFQYLKFNKIKGIIYMLLIQHSTLSDTIIGQDKMIKNELNNVNNSMQILKKSSNWNNPLRYTYQKLIKILNDMDSIRINSIINDDVIFKINYKHDFILNSSLFNLEKSEFIIFNDILNYIIYNINTSNKDDIQKIIYFIISNSNKNDDYKPYLNDITVLYERVVNQDYSQNINNVKSILFKNIFAFASYHNNIIDFNSFIQENNIKDNYISYILYGSFWGYQSLNNSIISDKYLSNFSKRLLPITIDKLDFNFLNIKSNIQHTRDKIHFILYYLINTYKNDLVKVLSGLDLNLSLTISKSSKKHINILSITDNNSNNIVIEYYPDSGKTYPSTMYFRNKNKRIKKINRVIDNIDSHYVFNYYFLVNNKPKALDINLEKKYMILLGSIYKQLQKKENKNE